VEETVICDQIIRWGAGRGEKVEGVALLTLGRKTACPESDQNERRIVLYLVEIAKATPLVPRR